MKLKYGEIRKVEEKDEVTGRVYSWYEIWDGLPTTLPVTIEKEDKAAVIKFLQEN